MNARYRPAGLALIAIVAVWVLAWGGYEISDHFKVTAERLRAYLASRDLKGLSGDARARALRDLEDKINALSPEERRKARMEGLWSKWFAEMSDDEKGQFLDATLPSGFHQMLASFEQQPAEKRHKAIDNAIKKLQEARDQDQPQSGSASGSANSSQQPVLSPDLQKRVLSIGVSSVYTDSSAQTKAELAPLLEEIQKSMENGRMFRAGPQ
jgi:hypothetical protein